MRRFIAFILALFFIFAASFQALAASSSASGSEFAPGEALVLCDNTFMQSLSSNRALRSASASGSEISVLDIWDLSYSKGLNNASASGSGEEPLLILRLSAPMDTDALVSYLKTRHGVVAAEPNYIYHADSISNDPAVDLQWGLGGAYGIHPQSLWASAAGESIVAVIDTGVDYNSPDLQGRIAPELAFDAYPSGSPTGTDVGTQGHGTHVAGIIAAATNNSIGIAGTMGNVNCKIMPVNVFNGDNTFASDIVAGINHVIQKKNEGKAIVAANMSLGGDWFSSEVTRYTLSRLTEAGILPVRSAGNDSLYIDEKSVYPSLFETPGTVAVAAIDENGVFDSSYSNYSDTCVHVAAPGTNILSTWFKGKGGYVCSSGSLHFDDFENSSGYSFKYAPYTWNEGIVESDAVLINTVPQAGGYASLQSLQFSVSRTSKYSDFRVILPNNSGDLQSGQSLGLWVRFACEQALPSKYSLVAAIGSSTVKPSSINEQQLCELDKWYYMPYSASSDGEFSLWVSIFDVEKPITVFIDDLGSTQTSDTGYTVFEGTSMAAPHFTGAYALLRAAYPQKSMAELRARLIGGSRADASLASRVNAGGSVDLSIAVLDDTSTFAPVVDTIEQNGKTITVNGWFFGSSPSLTLGSQTVSQFSQTGTDGQCSIVFELPSGISGVQTLRLDKSNGRSYRIRYDYSPLGNMAVIGELPEAPNNDLILNDVFAYGDSLYYLVSTASGFSICSYENGAYSPFISKESAGDRAARDDFSSFVDGNILYVYDYNHIHRFDMASKTWLDDIASPYTLNSSASFYTGAVAFYNGRLMLIGGLGSGADKHIKVYENGGWSNAEIIDESFNIHSARAINVNGKLAVFAMNSSNPAKNAIFLFDGQSWSKRDCPYSDLCYCSFSVLNGEILCFGDPDAQAGILAYNPSSDSWRRLPYYGTGLAYTACGTVSGTRIYAVTAQQGSDIQLLQYADVPQTSGGTSESVSSGQTDVRKYPITRQGSEFILTGADISKASALLLNGEALKPDQNYSFSDNRLQLSDSLLARLPDGKHSLRLVFPDGYAEIEFEIKNGRIFDPYALLPPATGGTDAAPLLLLFIPLCIALHLKRRQQKTAAENRSRIG